MRRVHIVPTLALLLAIALGVAACGGGDEEAAPDVPAPDLEIERRTGYAVVVDESGGLIQIAFNPDRDAETGEGFDVTESVWRLGDGAWNQPPISCLGRGQRLELGIAQVQNESQPGLLKDYVVWVSCLAPAEGD
jgi:hypothetical protein